MLINIKYYKLSFPLYRYYSVTESEEIIPIYWFVAAVTLGNIPRAKNNGLIIVPPAIPRIPESIPDMKHIETRKVIVEYLSKCRSFSSKS